MSQAGDLGIELESCLALRLSELELALLVLADIVDTNSLAEICKDAVLCLVDDRGECVDLLLDLVIGSLCLQRTSLMSPHGILMGCKTHLPQLRLNLPNLTIDVLEFILDPVQLRLAGTLKVDLRQNPDGDAPAQRRTRSSRATE